MGLLVVGVQWLMCSADWVRGHAPVAHDFGVRLEVGELSGGSWEPAVNGGAIAKIVGLVGCVADVTEYDHSRN